MSESTAVVIGASMAGLLSARVLADHFERVVVVERDALPDRPEPRRGVPQGRHAHALLASGRGVLERLFPSLTEQLVELGCPTITDPGTELRWFDGGGYHRTTFAPDPDAAPVVLATRPFLEHAVRMRVAQLGTVTFLQECDVVGLVTTRDASRVRGVRLVRRTEGASEEALEADLTVDASGRGSRTPAWLEALGFGRPPVQEVNAWIGYASRLYRHEPQQLDGVKTVLINPDPPVTNRLAIALVQEGGRWLVALGGFGEDYPPLDDEGFLAFARSLTAPDVYRLVSEAEALSDPIPYRFKGSVWNRYDLVSRFPDGYLVIGDAVCSFNPIYGQGMSVAAMEAECLGDVRRRNSPSRSLWKPFFAGMRPIIDSPWRIVVGGDLRFPTTEGRRTRGVHFVNWYLRRFHQAAHVDADLSRKFVRVAMLLDPPDALMRPNAVWRVARRNVWGALGGDRGRSASAGSHQLG